eukprot:gi/632963165/ref/XP_007897729.1/ PREDICTED: cleavage and polyadenylation specificity factor subunit 6-like isoform X2 [Callorhinchus milii]
MGCAKMAVLLKMAGELGEELLDAESAGEGGSRQLEIESEEQKDLYDDLINDIIGVPLNNGLVPKETPFDFVPAPKSFNITIQTKPVVVSKPALPQRIEIPCSEEKVLLIGNLTWWTTNDDIMAAIRTAGICNVDRIKFYEVQKGGQSKGFVKVCLSSDWDLNRLLEMLPKKEIHGRIPDVRCFTMSNRQYFEMQFINAMENSKLHLPDEEGQEDYDKDDPEKSDNESLPDALEEATEDPDFEEETPSPFQQPVVKLISEACHPPCPPPPNVMLRHLIPLGLPAGNLLPPGLIRHSQTLNTPHGNLPTFLTPVSTGQTVLDSSTNPQQGYCAYTLDYRIPRREMHFPEKSPNTMEFVTEINRTQNFPPSDGSVVSKDGHSNDYGTLIKLVSLVKQSKAIAQDGYRDSPNCTPEKPHNEEPKPKPHASGSWEKELSRKREKRRSGERSGSRRDRSRSPGSHERYYREREPDYDRGRQHSHQRDHSPHRDYYPERNREQRDSCGKDRPCDSPRYSSRSNESWDKYPPKTSQGQDYTQEKYCGIKPDKDRNYRF